MASGVVARNDEESASLLDDDGDGGSPVSAAGASPPPLPGKATMRGPRHAVMRLIRSPFAAALRLATCAREAAIGTGEDERRPSNGGGTAGAERERERRRGARRRPSLEQLLRMEAAPPPPRPDRKSEPADTAPSHDVTTCTTVQEKPVSPSKGHSTVVAGSEDHERRHAAAAPAVIIKSDGCGGAGRRQKSTKRLVVVFASLRQCSRASGISVAMTSNGPNGNGKVAAAGGRGPGELFYYRPIPMGRRCRVQHLEETPYK